MSRFKNAVLSAWMWLHEAPLSTVIFAVLMLLIIWGIHYGLGHYEQKMLDHAQQEYNQLPHRRGR